MQILTLDNKTFNLNNLPDEIDEDLRFSVLDNSNPNEPDFFFIPLVFLESFNAPAVVLKIGNYQVQMPLDWSIVVGCHESGNDLEVISLTSLTNRGFDAFVFNPISDFKFSFLEVEILNVYMDFKWYFPKMKNGQLLAVPLREGDEPPCVFFVKDISRQSEIIQYAKLM
jgi:hypothetical protein